MKDRSEDPSQTSNVCLYYLTYLQNESLLLDTDWLQLVMLHALSGHHVPLVQTVTAGCLFILFNIFAERESASGQWLAAVHLALSGHHVLLVQTVTAGLSNVCLYYLTYFQNETLLLQSDWPDFILRYLAIMFCWCKQWLQDCQMFVYII